MSVRLTMLAGCVFLAFAFESYAQTATPDFSSENAGWITMGGEFIAVPGSPKPVTQDPAYRYVPNNTSEQPTYRISDVSNPNLKPWARDAMKKDNDEVVKGKIAYTARQACKPGGVPDFNFFGVRPHYFLQTPKEVTIIYSGDAQVRRIYLDVPHSANVKPSWYGESVGHYEGDTLVVDTIGLNDKTMLDNFRTPHTDKLHVVERYRLVEGGKSLEVAIHIDDPDTFNQPWDGIQRFRKVNQQMQEEICAEGNFMLFNYGIPVAEKFDF